MASLKRLLSDTMVYGVSSMAAKFLNYLLVPLYTLKLANAADYGVVSVMFSYCTFINVILTFGMETSFFNFARKTNNANQVFSTAIRWIAPLAILFVLLCVLFAAPIMQWIEYPNHQEYVYYFALIIAADSLVAIALAKVRYDEKPYKFAFLRLSNIAINIGFNLFFILLLPYLAAQNVTWATTIYKPYNLIAYIFISNMIASLFTFLLLLPSFKHITIKPALGQMKEMFTYAWPLVIAGLAGMVNETLDRIMLKKLLPNGIDDTEIGIYSAFYKVSLIITIFLQAYRYAAEPILFKGTHNKQKNIADMTKWFAYACAIIHLSTMAFLPELAHLLVRNTSYFADNRGLFVVPILLSANIFLGLYFNVSMWYKLDGKTKTGAKIAIIGAFITIVLNALLIPKFSFIASAWITAAAYGSMLLLAFFLGQKNYPIPYETKKIGAVLILAIAGSAIIYYLPLARIYYLPLTIALALLIFAFEKNGNYSNNKQKQQ